MIRYLIDTNLYIRAFRSREGAEALEGFYAAHTPVCHLSSIVLHELLVGARPGRARQLHDHVARPFVRTGRIVTPSHAAWRSAGETVARLANEDGLDLRSLPHSFFNDVLLAHACRETGSTLVTENRRDFERIARVVRFEWQPPWPR